MAGQRRRTPSRRPSEGPPRAPRTPILGFQEPGHRRLSEPGSASPTGYPVPDPKPGPPLLQEERLSLEGPKGPTRHRRMIVRPLEVGVTGTTVQGGLILQDPNAELRFPRSVAIYDKMRRTDGQVKAALLAITLPVLSLEWDIEPHRSINPETGEAGDPAPQDQEIARFIRSDLLEGMSAPWRRVLREILGMLWAGFWIVEPVWETREDGLVHLRKLGSRLPSSVFRWQIARDGGLEGIVQRAVNPATGAQEVIPINARDLILYVHEKEGADWSGISVLRSAYKHWYMKDWLYRIGVINTERGGGFPVISLPPDATPADLDAAHNVGESVHIHERAYVIEPPGWRFRLETGVTRMADVMSQVQHHDHKIASNILAQFMDLGVGESGSRALAGEFIDLFLMALENVITNIEDTTNHHLIKPWVDWNWQVAGYPKLRAQNIRGFNVRRMGTILRMLADGQLVVPDEPLESFLRKAMGLPTADPDTRRGPGGGGGGLASLLGGGGLGPLRASGGSPVPPPGQASPAGPEGARPLGDALAANPRVTSTGRVAGVGGQEQAATITGGVDQALAEPQRRGALLVEPPAGVLTRIERWREQVPAALLVRPPGRPHVIVKAGVTALDPREVERAVSGVRSLRVTLGPVIVQPELDRDIVAALVEAPDLRALRAQVEQRLAWDDTQAQDDRLVLVLAEVRQGAGAQFAGASPLFTGLSWTAESLIFAPRAGPEQRIPLVRPHFQTFDLAERPLDLLERPLFFQRPLTDWERCCSFTDIDVTQKGMTKRLLERVTPIIQDQVRALAEALRHRRFTGLGQVRVPLVGKLSAAIRDALLEVYRFGQRTVLDELARQALARHRSFTLAEPIAEDAEIGPFLGARADVLAERWAARAREAALGRHLQAVRSGEDPKAPEAPDNPITQTLTDMARVLLPGLLFGGLVEAFALGRRAQAEDLRGRRTPEGEPVIREVQYSAVMDENTCEGAPDRCRELDGVIAPIDDPRMQTPNPNCLGERFGRSCRCILVYGLA